VALLRAAIALKELKLPGDEQIGVDIIRRACEGPSGSLAGPETHR